MKIIDNKKDFYDYLSGINGIDEYVVYDRRGSSLAKKELDSYGRPFNTASDDRSRDFYLFLQAGEYKKRFLVSRKSESGKVEITVEEYKGGHLTKAQKSWMPMWCADPYYGMKDIISEKAPVVLAYRETGTRWNSWEYMNNPILDGLPLVGLLSAQEIWEGIYNYLLKMKEPEITDSRTDEEKAESHGFDRKTSFRKDKEGK